LIVTLVDKMSNAIEYESTPANLEDAVTHNINCKYRNSQ
jgi:hypothetical protein